MSEEIDISMLLKELDYRHEYFAEWVAETAEQRTLRELAEEYHRTCDTYDRQVCSGTSPRSGEPMPANPYEEDLVKHHAYHRRKEQIRKAKAAGFTDVQIYQSIQDVAKKWRGGRRPGWK